MRKTTTKVSSRQAKMALLGFVLMAGLSGCNTTRGAGEDITSLGKNVSHGATQAQKAIHNEYQKATQK